MIDLDLDEQGRHGYAPNAAGDCVRCLVLEVWQDHPDTAAGSTAGTTTADAPDSTDQLHEQGTPSTAATTSRVSIGRSGALDKLRGLAIAAMVVDHLAYVLDEQLLRVTVGRLALPLFFIVAGHLVCRLSWRHGWVALLGLALPAVVPWIDDPNVLLLYAAGAVLVVQLRRAPLALVLVVVVALTVAANGWLPATPGFYDPLSVLALMCAGALLSRDSFAIGNRLPRAFAVVGRFPLSVYVGHLLVIEGVRSL